MVLWEDEKNAKMWESWTKVFGDSRALKLNETNKKQLAAWKKKWTMNHEPWTMASLSQASCFFSKHQFWGSVSDSFRERILLEDFTPYPENYQHNIGKFPCSMGNCPFAWWIFQPVMSVLGRVDPLAGCFGCWSLKLLIFSMGPTGFWAKWQSTYLPGMQIHIPTGPKTEHISLKKKYST